MTKTIKTGPLCRSMNFERGNVDEESRTVSLSFSSEEPYERFFGIEILGHDAKQVRLDRIKNRAPLLMDHNHRDQIGVVESVKLNKDSRKGEAVVRFGKGARADEIFNDVKDDIRSLVSVGYRVHKMKLEEANEDGPDIYRVTDWEPFEISLVSVPADTTVGVGRQFEGEGEEEVELIEPDPQPEPVKSTATRGDTPMPDPKPTPEANPEAPAVNVEAIRSEAEAAERTRVADLMEIGGRFDSSDLAKKFIRDGKTVDELRAAILDQRGDAPIQTVADPTLGLSDAEAKNYSLFRAIDAYLRKDWSGAGFERECSIALQEKMQKEKVRGFLVPTEAFNVLRTLDTATAGTAAELVGTDHRGDMFIELLRARSVVSALGARTMQGLVGNVDIPRQTGATTFSWLAEGGDATDTDPTVDNVTLSPKTVAGSVPMTRRLRLQSDPSVERIVLEDLLAGAALAIDLAALVGGGANQPTGIQNTTGVGSVTLGAGAVTWNNLVDLESEVAVDNALGGSLAYVMNAVERGICKKTKKDAGSGIFLMDGNEANGYPVAISNQMANDKIIFGNFADVMIGMWGGLDIKPDEATLAASDGLILRAFQDVDVAVRHPQSFAVGGV